MLTVSGVVLHQPSITGSRINLSPPSGTNSKELRIGHPPTARDDTGLSAIISPEPDAPCHEVRPAEPSTGSPPKPLPLPSDTDKGEGSPFLRTRSSSEASSNPTVINLQTLPEPAGITGHETGVQRSSRSRSEVVGVNNESVKVCGLQYNRHSRRQLSFCSGDDSGLRMKGLTSPTKRNTQSSSGILIKSVACGAEQSSLSASPIHGCAQTQGFLEGRKGSNYSVALDGRTEVFGPSAHMSVPGVSAVESLKRVQAAVRTTRQEETGSTRTLNTIAASVFARRVLQSMPTENNNDSQKTLVVEPAYTLFKDTHSKRNVRNNHAESRDAYL
jgi:hypothetical protein